MQKQVADFNRENSDYYIEILSYEDREDSYRAFLMDLTTGKEADIVVLPSAYEEVFLEKICLWIYIRLWKKIKRFIKGIFCQMF